MSLYSHGLLPIFCPCIIWGTDRHGKRYPDRRTDTRDVNASIREYRRTNPKVVHVNIDLALPYDENS